MISDSAGHIAKNQSGLPPGRKGQCIPAHRVLLSSSSRSPFSSTVSMLLVGQIYEGRIPEWQLSPLTVLSLAGTARWRLPELGSGGAAAFRTASSSSQLSLCLSENPLATPNSREGERLRVRRGHLHTHKPKYAGTTAAATKDSRGGERRKEKETEQSVCVWGGVGGEQGQEKSPNLLPLS